MRVWIDIDNPPQVQYLLPLAGEFEKRGASPIVTARDQGMTVQLLRQADAAFTVIGTGFGRTKTAKAVGLLRRATALVSSFRRADRPDVVVSSSRSSALAARWMRIPAFIVCDYEFVDLRSYRHLGVHLLFPDVIDQETFKRQGFPAHKLIPFEGLKEDLSFTGLRLEEMPEHAFAEIGPAELVRVLFRPPAEESHYYAQRSGAIARSLLRVLAAKSEAVVIFAPRYGWQSQAINSENWVNEPVLLQEAVPFVPLLKTSDLVISSGGTMLREAAYLGIPAYSAFGGQIGQVDRFLASIGRLHFISSSVEFERIKLRKRDGISPLRLNPSLASDIAEIVLERSA